MTSWVHLFSKFTSEALLFEAAFICFLIGSYIAYSVVRKRREGAVAEAVPSSVVKVYLNELITDAEQMRAQLFGLLQSSGISPGQIGNGEAGAAALLASLQARHGSESAAAGAQDSELLHKISALEARMKDQARAMELLVQEKTRIEGELSLARATAEKPQPSGASTEGPDTSELQKKIAQLEGKLAEYSVIEDDLANLKRLQQENTELRTRLSTSSEPASKTDEADPEAVVETPVEAEAVSAAAVETPAEAVSAVEVSAEAPAPAPVEAVAEASSEAETPETAPAEAPADSIATATDAEPVAVETSAEAATVPKTESPASAPEYEVQAAFETLATQVDASLAEVPPQQAAAEAPAANEKPAEEEKKPSEADLLAEFEKMLNG